MVLPLLSMLLVGIIYCGIAFYDYVALANAVAGGARILAVSAGAGVGPPTACNLAETALKNAAGSLNQSQIIIAPETFGSSTCTHLQANDWATISASYPCNLAIPFTGINLCPVQGSSTSTICPYSYCISSTTTVRIE
jgi:Flp pilus assembly protein TadG